MSYYQVIPNPNFVGRQLEMAKLAEIHLAHEASIIIVSGRRRVGKTELIEQFFRNDRILKFEGIQTKQSRGRSYRAALQKQFDIVLHRLNTYELPVPSGHIIKCWNDFFELISPWASKEPIILYFEEIQWLSVYQDDFLAELKPIWDDKWRHNPKLRIVISGSSPSFIARQFMSSNAIYNRSDHHIYVNPFKPYEAKAMLPDRGMREALLAILLVGSIPGYLKRFQTPKSVLETIYEESFSRNGYFAHEYERVFVSSMADSSYYRQIIGTLSKRGPLNRAELAEKVTGSDRAGGEFTKVLDDLVRCQFLDEYTSIHTPKAQNRKKYRISDPFLLFYHGFIHPQQSRIAQGYFDQKWSTAVSERSLTNYLGFAFERWVRDNTPQIAKILGFDGVHYSGGSFYHKSQPGFQIDLLMERADHTLLVIEAKYTNTPLTSKVATEVDLKINRMLESYPRYSGFTIRKVLVVNDKTYVPKSLQERFDHVLSSDEFFST